MEIEPTCNNSNEINDSNNNLTFKITSNSTVGMSNNNRDQLKRKLTLDLPDSKSVIKKSKNSISNNLLLTPSSAGTNKLELLSSPDLQLLKLGSPDLEKLILSQTNNLQTPTPLGQYFLNNNTTVLNSPKTVTQEQEFYVKGFQEALIKLHQQNGSSVPTILQPEQQQQSEQDPLSNTDWSSNASEDTNSMTSNYSSSTNSKDNHQPHPVLMGGVGAPAATATGRRGRGRASAAAGSSNANDSGNFDLASQDKMKLERKRQRNRVAASKCRKRKLERIAKLEEKVKKLKVENGELSVIADRLKDNVAKLHAEIQQHAELGCHFDKFDGIAV